MFLLRQVFGNPGAEDAVEQGETPVAVPLRHGLGEGTADEILPLFPDEAGESGIEIRHDVRCPLDGDHRLGRQFGQEPAEAGQVGRIRPRSRHRFRTHDALPGRGFTPVLRLFDFRITGLSVGEPGDRVMVASEADARTNAPCPALKIRGIRSAFRQSFSRGRPGPPA